MYVNKKLIIVDEIKVTEPKSFSSGRYVCIICGRKSDNAQTLCRPVKVDSDV